MEDQKPGHNPSGFNVSDISQALLSPVERLEKFLEAVVNALEAERGFVMLYNQSIGQFDVYATMNLDSELIFTTDAQLFTAEGISLTIIDQVIREGKPAKSASAIDDPRFRDKKSVILSQLRSFVCVPILCERGLLGVLYVDHGKRRRDFEEKHMQYLTESAHKLSGAILKTFSDVKPVPFEEILHHKCLELRKPFQR